MTGSPCNIGETGNTGENRKFLLISISDFTYAIYISFDSKFYFRFNGVKIFEIGPRKFFKSVIPKCVGGNVMGPGIESA